MKYHNKIKILLLLQAGFGVAYAYHPGTKWRILKNTYYEWKNINRKILQEELQSLYRSQYISKKQNKDGSFTVFLTEKGRVRALMCRFPELMKQKEWDGKWRLVTFDVPEEIRRGRNVLRSKLKELGFHELQKSVFVFPYECKKELLYIVSFFKMKRYVRYGVLESVDNDSDLRKIFNIKK